MPKVLAAGASNPDLPDAKGDTVEQVIQGEGEETAGGRWAGRVTCPHALAVWRGVQTGPPLL